MALTGRIDQLRDDSSAYITVVRSKRDADAPGTVVAITPAAKQALNVIRLAGIGGDEKVLGLSE